MWITLTAGRYRLDPALTGTDLQGFQAALEAARTAGDDQARLAALRQAVACYRGPLADGAGLRLGRALRRDRPPPRPGRLGAHRRDPPARRPRAGPGRAGGRPDPRPLQRVHLPADHAAAGRSGPRRRRPPHPRPAGIQARRAGRHAGRQHPPARRRPAGHRRTTRQRQQAASAAAPHVTRPQATTALRAVTRDHSPGGNRKTCPRRTRRPPAPARTAALPAAASTAEDDRNRTAGRGTRRGTG